MPRFSGKLHATSVGEHRFEKFRHRLAALTSTIDPAPGIERQMYLQFLDQRIVEWYRNREPAIHVVTGALRRTLTATSDSGRELKFMAGTTIIALTIKHPGMYYHSNIVAPPINLGVCLQRALPTFLHWRAQHG